MENEQDSALFVGSSAHFFRITNKALFNVRIFEAKLEPQDKIGIVLGQSFLGPMTGVVLQSNLAITRVEGGRILKQKTAL